MSEWEETKLGEIAEYVTEKAPIDDVEPASYFSTENMLPNRGGVCIAATIPSYGKVTRIRCNDVLISNIRPYFKKIWRVRGKGTCSADVLCFRAKVGVDSRFLFQLLSADSFFDYMVAGAKGTKMPRGDKQHILEYPVSLPPLPTQRRIAAVLSALDDKIELNNRVNANLEAQAQALFRSWFVDFEPFLDQPFIESEFGKIPVSFKMKRISELPLTVTDFVANGSFATLKENVKLYPTDNYAYFIRNTDLKSHEFNVYVDEHSYHFLSKSKLEGGEIIISNVGDVGSVHLCPKLDKPMTLGNNVIMLKIHSMQFRNFLYILFKWNYGQGLIQSITGGSAQPKFNKTDFKQLRIAIPDSQVIDAFNDLSSSYFKKIQSNNEECRNLAAIRDALLPKLMRGEIDVEKVEVAG